MNATMPRARRLTPCLLLAALIGAWAAGVAAQEAMPQDETASPLDERIRRDWLSLDDPFVITPHKPNYILPLSYNSRPNRAPFRTLGEELDTLEMKFQLSLKFSIWRRVFGDNGHLVFGYTQQAYWQAYNADVSSPFRETNHEPEFMLEFLTDWELPGFRNRILRLGLSHQSNGQAGDFSRSWNRVYAELVLVRGDLVLSIKPWSRLPEDPAEDDNPGIEDFIGDGELRGVYKAGPHILGLTLRSDLDSGSGRGAVQLDWSYPINDKLRGYMQYFNGYGESLIDYDASVNRIGVGVMLSDWL